MGGLITLRTWRSDAEALRENAAEVRSSRAVPEKEGLSIFERLDGLVKSGSFTRSFDTKDVLKSVFETMTIAACV